MKKHHELIEKDDKFIFAVFDKNQQHIGMVDVVTFDVEIFSGFNVATLFIINIGEIKFYLF
ncbi:hypothetical protein [Staphylococcus delphini]|uniref:hypothetical protein n=1 Tax=Staphylococcus delphini TaxID=53344 RepID=UPI0023B2570F|nr:hypothetical protein [Staphylococcus delphini]MDE9751704.1 hypothetical protein [Staphylococcus delphini]MDE9788981.1 hypothetical protein [Staphylococcus delphini]MDE9793716.1 hypothetical protein [Staphylococcus delphini]MDE9795934.1 hypothetical protein [Staphylococcus delphini]HEC2172117.1 hypothetical protein [Staphylococcus delphini]